MEALKRLRAMASEGLRRALDGLKGLWARLTGPEGGERPAERKALPPGQAVEEAGAEDRGAEAGRAQAIGGGAADPGASGQDPGAEVSGDGMEARSAVGSRHPGLGRKLRRFQLRAVRVLRLPLRPVNWLFGRWQNRQYKRWRDLPIRASFVLYTLAAVLVGTLVCLTVITMCNNTRIRLQNKYAEMSVSHSVPERGSYDVRRMSGRMVTVTIYDEEGVEMEQFTVNLRLETLAYDTEIRSNFLSGEPTGGIYMGSYYGPHGFVVTPRYTGEDNLTNITAVTVSVLIVPVSYIGALILCATLFYRRKLKKPLAILKNGSDRIARSDLDFTVAYDSRNELGQLCDSFEIMRGTLARNNRELWRSVEERRRLNAAFSHDLRTPLTVLKGHAAMLTSAVSEGNLTDEELAAELNVMNGSIARLERYVEAMARLQRLEDARIDRRPVDFDELADALRDTAQMLCGALMLNFEAKPGPAVSADMQIVQQVCENLLSNGARYARTTLDVWLWTEPGRLLVRVRDDGPGFSAADLEKATEPFYRDKSTGDGHLGLGLNICKILCQRHDGGVKLENDGGGCVTVWFGGE